jgi:putative endonuclease
MTQKSEIGVFGEDLTCKYLENKGYKVVDRNFRRPWGELDIIIRAPDRTLVFVEVKTLWENEKISPEENLTAAKLRKFKKAAMLYAGSKQGQILINDKKGWRMDLVAIILKNSPENGEGCEIKHYENIV